MIFYDWNLYQWAEAAQAFADRQGWLPVPGIEGAATVRKGWESWRDDKPAGRQIIVGVEKPLAIGWAYRMFLRAAIRCGRLS